MKVLEISSTGGSWSKPFADRGHEVKVIPSGIGVFPTKRALRTCDLLLVQVPCRTFSMLTNSFSGKGNYIKHWETGTHRPLSDEARAAVAYVEELIPLLETARGRWIVENPMGQLRHVPVMQTLDRRTITYCQYGHPIMKKTDLWGDFPEALELLPPCSPGDPCHSGRLFSNSKWTGRGSDKNKGAIIPYELGLQICMAMELEKEIGR